MEALHALLLVAGPRLAEGPENGAQKQLLESFFARLEVYASDAGVDEKLKTLIKVGGTGGSVGRLV